MTSKNCKCQYNNVIALTTGPLPKANVNCNNQTLKKTITLPSHYTDILTFESTFTVATIVQVNGVVTFHHTQGPVDTFGVVGLVIEVDGKIVSHGKSEYEDTRFAPDLFTITLPWCGELSVGKHTIKLKARNYNAATNTVVVDPLSTVNATAIDATRGAAFLSVLLFDL